MGALHRFVRPIGLAAVEGGPIRAPQNDLFQHLEQRTLLATAIIPDQLSFRTWYNEDASPAYYESLTSTVSAYAGWLDQAGDDELYRGAHIFQGYTFPYRVAVDTVSYQHALSAANPVGEISPLHVYGMWSNPATPLTGSQFAALGAQERFSRSGGLSGSFLFDITGSGSTVISPSVGARLINYNFVTGQQGSCVLGVRIVDETWSFDIPLIDESNRTSTNPGSGLIVDYTGRPTLLSDRSVYAPNDPVHWTIVADRSATTNIDYRLQASTDPSFASIYESEIVGNDVVDGQAPSQPGTYYVRVQARNNTLDSSDDFGYDWATSEWSPVRIIQVQQPEVSVFYNGSPIIDGQTQPVDFGSVQQGQTGPARTFTVRNDGNQTLTLSNLRVPSGFQIVDGLPPSLAQGASDDFTIRLVTTAQGTFQGDTAFDNNDANENPFNFVIVGQVTQVQQPEVSVFYNGSPIIDGQAQPIDFGTITLGQPGPERTFIVRNDGNSALTLGTLSVPSGFEVIEGLPSTLGPGGSDPFTVRLRTNLEGLFPGEISLPNNDSNENPFNFAIVGQVTQVQQPEVSVFYNGSPIIDGQAQPIDFGTITLGQPGPERTFIVRNDGNSALTLGTLSVPSGFEVIEGLPSTLGPGGSDPFTVRLRTNLEGLFPGEISLPNNDSNENPFNFAIRGRVGTDDHADAGEWSIASVIGIYPETGDGTHAGTIEVGDDTDLFRFTAAGTGSATVRIAPVPGNSLDCMVTVYTSVFSLVGGPINEIGAGAAEQFTFSVTAGQAYFVLVGPAASSVGTYALTLDGPPQVSDDHANAGQWTSASVVAITPLTGDGARTGIVEVGDDTDLFRFTPTASGNAIIRLTPHLTGSLDGILSVYSDSHGLVAGPYDTAPSGATEELTVSVVGGRAYYILVGSSSNTVGGYGLTVDGPAAPVIGLPVLGSANASGRLTLTVASFGMPSGSSAVYQQTGSGQVTVVHNLADATGSPAIQGAAPTWTDSRDGLIYACAPSSEGLLLFTNRAAGVWTWRNLSSELQGPSLANLTVFTSMDGVVTIAGISSQNHFILYQNVITAQQPNGLWSFTDLTTVQGIVTPQFSGQLVSYVTSWNGLNIAGLDASGRIQAVWWAPGQSRWQVSDLSAITGAPNLTGNLAVYLTPWHHINLVGTDANGRVQVTWWPGDTAQPWRTDDLTADAGGPLMAAGSLSTYVTPWGGLNVAGVDVQGRLTAYWWAPGLMRWQADVLSDIVSNDTPPIGAVTGVASPTGTINLVGRNASSQVVRYFWNPGDGGNWSFINLDAAGTPIDGAPNYSSLAGNWRITVLDSCLGGIPASSATIEMNLTTTGRFTGSLVVDGTSSLTMAPGTWAYADGFFEFHDFGETFLASGISANASRFDTHGGFLLLGPSYEQFDILFDAEEQQFVIDHCGSLQEFADSLVLRWDRIA